MVGLSAHLWGGQVRIAEPQPARDVLSCLVAPTCLSKALWPYEASLSRQANTDPLVRPEQRTSYNDPTTTRTNLRQEMREYGAIILNEAAVCEGAFYLHKAAGNLLFFNEPAFLGIVNCVTSFAHNLYIVI